MNLLTMLANLFSSLFVVGAVATPTPVPAVLSEEKTAYESRYFHVYPDQNLSLRPNFETMTSSGDLMDKHRCISGINGGFYTEQHRPIGWFVSEGKQISAWQKNQLFNGVLYRFEDGKADISYSMPDQPVVSGLQTGPILMYEGEKTQLRLSRDKHARRMVAATTRGGDILFITFYTKGSVLDGPRLDELPGLVYSFEQEHRFDITSAINMDGGAASAFVGTDTTLDEWQSVGSWWCLAQ